MGNKISPETKEKVGYLKQMEMFREVDTVTLCKLASVLLLEKFNQDEVIIEQGTGASYLYIVAEGIVSFSARDPASGQPKALASLERGQPFGEFGLVYDVNRTASAIAGTPQVVLLRLDRVTYEDLKDAKYMKVISDRVQRVCSAIMREGLRRLPFLHGFATDTLNEICNLFHFEVVPAGTKIFGEGDVAERFYIVIDGLLVMTKLESSEYGHLPYEIRRIRKGMRFGDVALLTEDDDAKTRRATVTTMAPCHLLSLSAYDFKRFVETLPLDVKQQIISDTYSQILKRSVEIFKSVKANNLELLGTISELAVFKQGDVILEEGKTGNESLFIVYEGEADFFKGNTYVKTIYKGYFGELGLFVRHKNSLTVKASSEELKCLKIPLLGFKRILEYEGPLYSELALKVLGKEITLHIFLKHPKARQSFEAHLKMEKAEESFNFFSRVERLKKLNKLRLDPAVGVAIGITPEALRSKKMSTIKNMCRNIHDDFIVPNSKYELNISGSERELIMSRVAKKDLSFDMFDGCRSEVLDLVEQDNFVRYKNSTPFKELLAEIGVYTNGNTNKA